VAGVVYVHMFEEILMSTSEGEDSRSFSLLLRHLVQSHFYIAEFLESKVTTEMD
jgi:hypothetical protein